MDNRSREIFPEDVREKMAADIAGLIDEFYRDPEKLKAFEAWMEEKDKGNQKHRAA